MAGETGVIAVGVGIDTVEDFSAFVSGYIGVGFGGNGVIGWIPNALLSTKPANWPVQQTNVAMEAAIQQLQYNLDVCANQLYNAQNDYNVCAENLNTCNVEVQQCQAGDTSCTTALKKCEAADNECIANLTRVQNDYNICNQTLVQTDANFARCVPDKGKPPPQWIELFSQGWRYLKIAMAAKDFVSFAQCIGAESTVPYPGLLLEWAICAGEFAVKYARHAIVKKTLEALGSLFRQIESYWNPPGPCPAGWTEAAKVAASDIHTVAAVFLDP